MSGRNSRCRPMFADRRRGQQQVHIIVRNPRCHNGRHDGHTGTIIDDGSAGEEASLPQLHQRQGQVHFCFVGRGIMRQM